MRIALLFDSHSTLLALDAVLAGIAAKGEKRTVTGHCRDIGRGPPYLEEAITAATVEPSIFLSHQVGCRVA